MRFTISAPAFAALMTLVAASGNAFSAPLDDAVWAAGSSHRVSWANPAGKTITLDLMEGSSDDLSVAASIGTTENTGSITWQIPSNIHNGTYALRITNGDDSSDVNYSPWFVVSNNNTVSASSAPASSAVNATTATNATTAVTTSGVNATTSGSRNSSATATGSESDSDSETGSASGSARRTSSGLRTASATEGGSSGSSSTGRASASASGSNAQSNAANFVGAGVAGILGAAVILL